MSPNDWLQLLTLGALAGAAGQGARVIVGIKKLSDAASGAGSSVANLIEPSRLIISLIIGAVAGILAATQMQSSTLDTGSMLKLAGIGYIGADFIEGFMRTVSADPGAPIGSDAKGSGRSAASPPASSGDDAVG
jgi:uncharacterized membrane protein YeaQ/YmgE (transglycosylase-associated protein family)